MKKTQIFEPIKDQLYALIEYITILEQDAYPKTYKLSLLVESLNNMHKQTEAYLNYQYTKRGKND